MAVRIDASGESLKLTSGLPSISTGATAMAWFYLVNNRGGTPQNLLAFEDSGTNYDQVYFDGTVVQAWSGGSVSFSPSYSYSAGKWVHVAMVHNGSGNQWTFYAGGTSRASGINDGISNFSNGIWFGDDRDNEWFDGRVAYAKIWDIPLTADQVLDEMRVGQPRNALASLNCFWPLFNHSNAIDYGPNARNPTVAGTLATEDGPPIPWRHGGMRRYYKPAAGGGPIGTPIPVFMNLYRQRWA